METSAFKQFKTALQWETTKTKYTYVHMYICMYVCTKTVRKAQNATQEHRAVFHV